MVEMYVDDAESIQFLQTCCDGMSYCIISYWSFGQFTVNMIDKDFVKDCPAKRVAVGKVWGRSNHQIPPTGFIPTPLDIAGNKTYSNRNSAKQVPQVEGLTEQQQTTMTPSHVIKVIAQ